jgi:hypothetical protein
MGWSYRKSVNLGPFRVNLSKSGIGYSLGGGGFRTGVNSRGRSYRSLSIPGTGMRYYSSSKQGCLVALVMLSGLTSITALILMRIWP